MIVHCRSPVHERTNVDACRGNRKQPHRREYREASAYIGGNDIASVGVVFAQGI